MATKYKRKTPTGRQKAVTEEAKIQKERSILTKEGYGFWSSPEISQDHTDILANHHYQYIEIYHIPSKSSIAFKAAMTQFQDNYKSDWTQTQVYGRMDPIGTFQRTSRTISVGFNVMAASIYEAEDNMQRISALTQMLYPEFKDANGASIIQGGPLLKIKFMNWISDGNPAGVAKDSGLLGWVDNVSFSPDLEIGVFQDNDIILPKKFDVNFTFFVVHEEKNAPGWRKPDSQTNQKVDLVPRKNVPYGLDLSEGIYNTLPNKAKLVKSLQTGGTIPESGIERSTQEAFERSEYARSKQEAAAARQMVGEKISEGFQEGRLEGMNARYAILNAIGGEET